MIDVKWIKGLNGLEDAMGIRMEVFVGEQGVPVDLEKDEMDAAARHVVVFKDRVPVGTGRIFMEKGQWMLGRVAVLKTYRGQHLGARVVKELLQRAFDEGAESVHIHAQIQVEPFYRYFGFKPYGEVFEEAGIQHISMSVTPKDAKDSLLFSQGDG